MTVSNHTHRNGAERPADSLRPGCIPARQAGNEGELEAALRDWAAEITQEAQQAALAPRQALIDAARQIQPDRSVD